MVKIEMDVAVDGEIFQTPNFLEGVMSMKGISVIARVGIHDFLISSLEDVEKIVDVFSRARPVEKDWQLLSGRNYYFSDRECEIRIEIVNEIEVLTAQEVQELRKQADEKSQKEKEDAGEQS